jgi:alpha-ribazole phosphatase
MMEIVCWRHPRLAGAEGLCIGSLDWPVDARRARRLADRIARSARRLAAAPQVLVSPLARCRAVGEALARRGWRVTVDARLREIDFGRWEGRRWGDIDRAEFARWEDDFLHAAPGGGEPVGALLARVAEFVDEHAGQRLIVVTHGGVISALQALASGVYDAARWPPPCGPARYLRIAFPPCASAAQPPPDAHATRPEATGSTSLRAPATSPPP